MDTEGPRPDHFVVGRIHGAHGIRGEVKVKVLTENAARFDPGRQLVAARSPFALSVVRTRPHRGTLLVQFAEIASRTDAEALQGAWLSVPASQIEAPAPGSYWVHDIIGARVETEKGQYIGQIRQVLETGANDVYEVVPAPALNMTDTLLLPAISDVIRQVDTARGIVTVHLLPGLVADGSEDI